MMSRGRRLIACWDRFLFETCDPRIAPVLRIGFAVLVLVSVSASWHDAERWLTDAGVLRSETAKKIAGPEAWSLFYVLPSTLLWVRIGLGALALHALLMLVGIGSRFQAAAIFVWMVSIENRNPIITDGEDTVFRLFAFLLIWLPLDAYWSILPRRNRDQDTRHLNSTAWGLRLIQFEFTAIYASTALCKLQGETWHDGTAMWHVSRMTDNFGRLVPSIWFDQYWVTASATWGALLIELLLPIALWIRGIRKFAIIAGVALHLAIEASMNLFLFEWIMILGLLAFVVPDEWVTRNRDGRDAFEKLAVQ